MDLNQKEMEEIKKQHDKATTFSFVFVTKNNFIKKPTGFGSLFYSECFRDDIFKSVKQEKSLHKLKISR